MFQYPLQNTNASVSLSYNWSKPYVDHTKKSNTIIGINTIKYINKEDLD